MFRHGPPRLVSLVVVLGATTLLGCSGSKTSDQVLAAAGTAGTPSGSGGTVPGAGGTVDGGSGAGGGTGATGGSGAGGSAGGASGGAFPGAGQGGSAAMPASGGAPASSAGGGATAGAATGGRGGMAGAGRGAGGAAAAGGAGGAAAGAGASGSGGGGGLGALPFSFYIGADVTDQETQSEAVRDTLLSIMKEHGFNSVRLRTFVDPKASDGYDKQNGYDDITHTVAFGKQIKAAGMGFLLDFHYSDNWADPGKQCVPIAWQAYTTIAELATAVHDYTKDSIAQLIAGGARPDMVQIGNEITPGMLLHRCDGGGQPTGDNPVTGSISNWTNLGTLLKAGVQGVKDVDPTILISLHIDRGGDLTSSKNFITNAQKQGVSFDAFGESCYTAYQGQPSGWQNTFTALASQFPSLALFIAEYGPAQKEANDIIFNLPNEQGLGTFNWEPTTQGAWNTGHDLLRRSGNTYTAQPDLALYDQMKVDYASRL